MSLSQLEGFNCIVRYLYCCQLVLNKSLKALNICILPRVIALPKVILRKLGSHNYTSPQNQNKFLLTTTLYYNKLGHKHQAPVHSKSGSSNSRSRNM